MTNSVLYYAFTLTTGKRQDYGGIWWFVTVRRVQPDYEEEVATEMAKTRWGALRLARRAARDDLRWLALPVSEEVLWRP